MIKKLDLPSSARLVYGKDYDLAFKYIKQTVNQLVDAVNGILDYAPLEMAMKAEPKTAENVQDKFAEQRRWQNKLCWFWNDGCADYIGILYKIHDLDEIPFENDLGEKYQHCRPVKPTDSIIYKGGDKWRWQDEQ